MQTFRCEMNVNPVFFVVVVVLYRTAIHAQPLLLHCEPDSHRTVLLIPPAEGHFEFSPLDPAAIWVGSYEIDVRSGQKREIIPGKSWHGSRREWYADPFDPEHLWFALPYEGLYRLRKTTRQITKIDVPLTGLTTFLPLKDGIWLANGYDLYFWERNTNSVKKEKNYPVNVIIRHLESAGDTLLVNDYYRYVPGECKLAATDARYVGVQAPEVVFRMDAGGYSLRSVQHFSYPEIQHFIRTPDGREYCFGRDFELGKERVAVRGREVWSLDYRYQLKCLDTETGAVKSVPLGGLPRYGFLQANRNHLWLRADDDLTCFDPVQQRFFHFPDTFSKGLLYLRCDERNVYLYYPNRFVVVSIAWLLLQGHDAADDWRAEEAFWATCRSLHPDSVPDLYAALEKYRLIQRQSGASDNLSIQRQIRQSAEVFDEILLKTPDSLYPQVVADIQQGRIEAEIVPFVLDGLMNYLGEKGQVQEAVRLADFAAPAGYEPQSVDFYPIRTAAAKLDSIASANMQPDARLYAEGQVFYQYCHEAPWFWNEFNCCVNTDLANRRFRRLLRDHPDSEWADDAAFDTLPLRSESCPGCDPLRYSGFPVKPEIFSAYHKVTSDYPHGNARPKALYRLAWLYAYQALNYGENAGQHIQSGLDCTDEIIQRYPAYEPEKVLGLKNRLQQAAWDGTWRMSLRAERPVVRLNEPLRIAVCFYNRTEAPQVLEAPTPHRFETDLRLKVYFKSTGDCNQQFIGITSARRNPAMDSPLQTPVPPGEQYKMMFDVAPLTQAPASWQAGWYKFEVKIEGNKREQYPWFFLGACEVQVSDE